MKITENLPFWGSLSQEEQDFLDKNATVSTFDGGSLVSKCQGECVGLIYVLSGKIRTFMMSDEGRQVTLFRLDRGDSCVLSATCVLSQITFEINMQATEKTELLIINSGAFARLMEENLNVKCFAYELALGRASSVVWVFQQIVFDKIDRRLAGFLLDPANESENGEIVMSKEAIAREINTAREVVSRMLRHFEEDGLLETKGKKIKIIDKNGLKKLL